MRKFKTRLMTSLFLLAAANNLYANGYQSFFNIAYDNPAMLNHVKNAEFMLGMTHVWGKIHFTGTVTDLSNNVIRGTQTSNRQDQFPYGRIAYRFNSNVVAGLDISNLGYLNTLYPFNSMGAASYVLAEIKDVNFGPRISIQVTPKLAIGFGINADKIYRGALASNVFNSLIVAKGQSWAYGVATGISYKPVEATTLNLSYFSKLNHHIKGSSSYIGITDHKFNTRIPFPTVVAFDLYQTINPKLQLHGNFTIQYIHFETVALRHLAVVGEDNIAIKLKPSYSIQGGASYQLTDKLNLLGAAQLDRGPQSVAYRSLGLPSGNTITGIAGAQYNLTKALAIKGLLAYTVGKPVIDYFDHLAGTITGRASNHATVLDLSMVYSL